MNFFKKNKGLFSMVAGTAALVASKVGEKLTETKKPIEKKQINIEYYVNALSEYQQQSEVLPTKEEITCPISRNIMIEPVITPYGTSYDKQSLSIYLQTNDIDPITKKHLTEDMIVDNYVLKEKIHSYMKANKVLELKYF